MATRQTAIKIEHVSKSFVLPHEKKTSVKSVFTSLFGGKKSHTTQIALKDIEVDIKQGEFFGIVGRNGSGKSTLLKIIAGIYQPTKGKISVNGNLVPFIELGVGFNPELTGKENVYLNGAILGFTRKHVQKNYQKVVEFSELGKFMDQKLKNYSSGMQVRLAFACATMAQADILLVDEVLAVGDSDFQRKCFNYFKQLKKENKTVVFVSHDMGAVKEYCDRAILIEKNEIIKKGKVSDVAAAYTKLFIPSSEMRGDTGEKVNMRRWGDSAIKYTNVCFKKQTLTQKDDEIEIILDYVAQKEVENPIFGFSLKNSGGTYLFGTNTRLSGKKIDKIPAGKKGKITWKLSNLLNDGDYFIDIAVSNSDETVQHDWWEDALALSVYREQHTTYVVEPPIRVSLDS